MRIFSKILQYACFVFAVYLAYQVGQALYSQDYILMDLVADIGTILICIDLGVFLWSSTAKQGLSLEEYARQLDQPSSKWVVLTRKLGHLGIMLILCSWIVPLIQS